MGIGQTLMGLEGTIGYNRDHSREVAIATALAESPTGEVRLMESICESGNVEIARKRVEQNAGAPGVDGMTVQELGGFLRRTWSTIKSALLTGTYRALPVRRKDIPKPDGGTRSLGIPAVIDRFVQRAFLQSGVSLHDVIEYPGEGTPQGGPLSPLLSNIVLDELDKELERRGLRFVRYADDIVILVRSQCAGERVLRSITRFVTDKLKLKVNEEKSRVSRPWEAKFLGFRVSRMYGKTRIVIHDKSVSRFKDRIREIVPRNRGANIRTVIAEISTFIRGWFPYYGAAIGRKLKKALNRWIIRRLKALLREQWKRPRTKIQKLEKLGIAHDDAVLMGNARKRAWRMSKHYQLNFALPQRLFTHKLGLVILT